MGLRDRLKRLERLSEGGMVVIPLEDGTVKKFPESALREAFLSGVGRLKGEDVPDHPLCVAARNSSETKWRESFYSGSEKVEDVEDLSE